MAGAHNVEYWPVVLEKFDVDVALEQSDERRMLSDVGGEQSRMSVNVAKVAHVEILLFQFDVFQAFFEGFRVLVGGRFVFLFDQFGNGGQFDALEPGSKSVDRIVLIDQSQCRFEYQIMPNPDFEPCT